MCNCQSTHPGTVCGGIGCACHISYSTRTGDTYRLETKIKRNKRLIEEHLDAATRLEELNLVLEKELSKET